MRLILFPVAAALLALWSAAQADTPEPAVSTERGVVYSKPGGTELALDVAAPKGDGPFPAVVCIHGGGWRAGDRGGLVGLTKQFAQAGYVAVTVSYRFTPKHPFPAQIHDCKAAVRWLRANAAKYKVDPERVGALGFSAGGHLASLLGTSDKNDGLEGDGGHPEQSSRIQAFVNFFGPTDFTAPEGHTPNLERDYLNVLLGGPYVDNVDNYRKASPLTYATKDDPPALFFHGTEDKLVPIKQSQRLAEGLTGLGVEAKLIEYQGAGHGWAGERAADSFSKSREFFDRHLKKPVAPAAAPAGADAGKREKDGVVVERNVPFGKGGGRELLADVARPAHAKGKLPAVVCAHGGGWQAGHRTRLSKANYLFPAKSLIEMLAEAGFIAVTVDYRLAPASRFPAQVEDCKAAVRWLRADAEKLGVDPERVGVFGYSAGGHLACMLGATDASHNLEGSGGHPEQSSRVQAVVSFYGPTVLAYEGVRDDSREKLFLIPFLGATSGQKPELYRKASPLSYVSRDDPPFLFVHGTRDTLVEPKQSQVMADALTAAGVSAKVVTVEGAGHAFGGETNVRAARGAIDFLAGVLKK